MGKRRKSTAQQALSDQRFFELNPDRSYRLRPPTRRELARAIGDDPAFADLPPGYAPRAAVCWRGCFRARVIGALREIEESPSEEFARRHFVALFPPADGDMVTLTLDEGDDPDEAIAELNEFARECEQARTRDQTQTFISPAFFEALLDGGEGQLRAINSATGAVQVLAVGDGAARYDDAVQWVRDQSARGYETHCLSPRRSKRAA